MSTLKPDDELLLIRCPSCGQRFKVGDDLRGRTVECGGCEHRFRINDEVIVRSKKFYPGERKNPKLDGFQRVPMVASAAANPGGLGPGAGSGVLYSEAPAPESFEPTPPQRILAACAGGAGMVCMALLLITGARLGGVLDGMITQNRLLMAGFTGLLGTILLIYGNPRTRGKAFAYGLLLTGGLLSLPFVFTVGSSPPVSARDEELLHDFSPSAPAQSVDTKIDRMADLRNVIGTQPLEAEIARLALVGSEKRAVGLWLRDLREENRYLIRDYILRTTGAEPQSHYYPRGDGDFLMVVTGIKQSLEAVAEVASVLGKIKNIHPEISIVEILVNNEGFREGPIEKLNNREDRGFYDANKRELESIDLERVSKAVKRLAGAEPNVYRSDITSKLISLLSAPWVDFKGDVCAALIIWEETPGPASDAALKEANALLAAKGKIPPEMVELIVKGKNPGAASLLDELWSADPMQWEQSFGDVGAPAEAALIRRFPETSGMARQSAVRILGRVGGQDSLPLLETANPRAEPELRVLIEASSAAIRRRIGE